MDQDTSIKMILSDTLRYQKNLLGYLISGNPSYEEILEIVERLHPEELYTDQHKLIYSAARLSAGEGIHPTITGLMHYLKQFESQISVSYSELSDMVAGTEVFTPGLASKAIEIIKTYALQRRLIQFHQQRAQEAVKITHDIEKFIAEDEYKLLEIEEGYGDSRRTSVKDVSDSANEKARYNFDNKVVGIRTGLSLDMVLGGFMPGHTWILGAFTGTGKTFLALQMSLTVLQQLRSVAFFSLEMSAEEIYFRLAGNITGKSALQLQTGKYPQELAQAKNYVDSFGDRFHIYDDVFTFEELRLRCKKQKIKYGLDVFFIDFMQNMRGEGSIYERMSTIVVQIQQLAKEIGATAVILSQLSNENAKEKSDVLSYKGAGEIAQVADVGLWLEKAKDHNGDTVDGQLKLIMRKSRHSASGLVCDLNINFKEGGKINERKS